MGVMLFNPDAISCVPVISVLMHLHDHCLDASCVLNTAIYTATLAYVAMHVRVVVVTAVVLTGCVISSVRWLERVTVRTRPKLLIC